MKLTPQHLAEVVTALQSATATVKGAEKRRAARMEVQGNVVIAPLTPDGAISKSFTAITRDISFVGIGLLQSMPLQTGQRVVVRLPRGEKGALFVLCKVMHVRPLADGLFVIGVEFDSISTITEESLLDQAGDKEVKRVRQLILN